MSLFERYLTIWVFLCIVAGILLGQLLPAPFEYLGGLEIASVNLPVAVLIWLMIIPMLLKVDFGALAEVREHWRGIGVTLFVVHTRAVRTLAAGRTDRFLYCRADPARSRAVHGHGLRLE
jgi:ACR3 family arsenite efflux pump ArsB